MTSIFLFALGVLRYLALSGDDSRPRQLSCSSPTVKNHEQNVTHARTRLRLILFLREAFGRAPRRGKDKEKRQRGKNSRSRSLSEKYGTAASALGLLRKRRTVVFVHLPRAHPAARAF